jgi:hypothetical protein
VVPEIAEEGLLIVGWVAMWRPLEIFLYDWRPIWRRCRLYAKTRIPVTVRQTQAEITGTPARGSSYG